MAWSTKFKNIFFENKARFLYNFLKIRPKEANLQKAYKDVLRFIVGGMYETNEYRYKSKLLKDHEWIIKPSRETKEEHTIPISISADYLLNLSDSNLTPEFLENFLRKIGGLSRLSKEEDARLNHCGLKSSLPVGITLEDILSEKVKHSVRYDHAKIEYDVNENWVD